ncbi:chromophore lyase CpcT/CpeT [Rhodocista pekingensis]|uniref:Chromophore lyase CpcT/CpeT n=1 Tax=Rhodocista pekingensis TaxID=201185 RepID=A0ABW2KRG8_9PROT
MPFSRAVVRPGRPALVALTLVGVLIGGLAPAGAARADESQTLAALLTGSFSTAQQAAGDPQVPLLRRQVTPIWPRRHDGPWLYVEEAPEADRGRPARQRIVQIRFAPERGGVELRSYRLPDPAAAVGAWRDPSRLKELMPEQLDRIAGCEVVLYRRGEWNFSGNTVGTDCADPDGRAAYLIIQMSVQSAFTRVWERGFTGAGEAVRDTVEGGFRFDKAAPDMPDAGAADTTGPSGR